MYFIGFRRKRHNRLLITRQSDGAVIVDVGQGVARVGRASSDFIEGSVFVQRIYSTTPAECYPPLPGSNQSAKSHG